MTDEPCACGRTLARMSRVQGGIDDLINLGAVKVFPSRIEQIILDIDGLGPHYEIVLDRAMGIDTMELRVERAAGAAADESKSPEKLRARLLRELEGSMGITAQVSLVEPRDIAPPAEGKARRVVDKRQI